MARKRLTPAQGLASGPVTGFASPPPPVLAPIASVAGQSATEAALQEVAGEMQRAREEGRIIQLISLEEIIENHLVRDRLAVEDEDMMALMASIRSRGQTTPIEVVELAPGRYGLISGWRRLQALRRLRGAAAPDDGRFGRIRALVVRPRDAGEAYVAMVEENEIRADLSHYERARIVARSVEEGAFADVPTALRTLFANASRAKRSKIKSFMALVEHLDEVLRFPTHLGERLGLELAGRLGADPAFASALAADLAKTPPASPEAEGAVIRGALDAPVSRAKQSVEGPRETEPRADEELAPGIWLSASSRPGRVLLTGPGVDDEVIGRLRELLGKPC